MSDDVPDDYQSLLAALDKDVASAQASISVNRAQIAALDEEQNALGQHPHYAIYRHGGIAAVRGMGVAHILAHAGFYTLPHPAAVAKLAEARDAHDDDCLITALKSACESDAMLEVAGHAWFDELGLLKGGALNPFWVKRPKLGLGYPARLYGLNAEDAVAHRGLYVLNPLELRERFAEVACSAEQTFGDLLSSVIASGGTELAAIGSAATEADAADRYWARCASFAAHQRATGDRRWRWKPPLSRQGHHARTIAEFKSVDMPSERTRGHAATWLDDNGANPRFRRD
jgi:hypothetical protein